MPCTCKPLCDGPCAIELLKSAMFSQPKKADGASKKANNTEEFNTIKHLELLFKEHEASEILKSGFDDAMVSL